MRAYLPAEEKAFQGDDFIELIRNTLHPND